VDGVDSSVFLILCSRQADNLSFLMQIMHLSRYCCLPCLRDQERQDTGCDNEFVSVGLMKVIIPVLYDSQKVLNDSDGKPES